MKNKIAKILGVALSLAVLASMLVVGAPASAGTLESTTEDLPFTTTVSFVDYAVAGDGNTIYGVVGTNVLYKSTNGGASWVTKTITGAPGFEFVAVAPDDPNIVAVGDAGLPQVWISTNGAATGEADSWSNAGTPGTIAAAGLFDLAISPAVSGVRQVAAAGAAAAAPEIRSLNLGGTVATWTDLTVLGTGVIGAVATTRVMAVRFSPNFVSDRLMVAVSNDSVAGAGAYMNLFRFNTVNPPTGLWNAGAGFLDYTGAGTSNGKIFTSVAGVAITSADLSLAPTYTGVDSASRNAFVAIDTGAVTDSGIYQLKDPVSKLIGDAVRMRSVAFNGTNLVAGRADYNTTYRSSDPLATTPTLTATTQFQRPSGGIGAVATNTQVAWAGANVVAATQGNESAFSVSKDNGANYQDVSMFRTSVTTIIDISVAPDGSKWYMVSYDGADISVWSKTGATWERLMSIVATAPPFTVRQAPENKNVVYLVQNGTQNIYYTDDGGDKNWVIRIANENVTDLAVESASVIYYAYAGGNIRKSTNSGFLWNDPSVNIAFFGTPYAIKSLGTDKLIVTSTGGKVAYSTNGGTSFSSLPTITGAGNLQATAATLATGDFVYAADSTAGRQIRRYKIGSVPPDNVWKAISPVATATESFTGLELKGGILYAHTHDTAGIGSRLWRALNPAEAGETSVVFSQLVTGLRGTVLAWAPDFTIAGGRVSNLQISVASGVNRLWAIDADAGVSEESGDSGTVTNDEVYSFDDTLAVGPTVTGPAADAVIPVNPVSGNTYSVTFTFNRPSLATDYTLQVALDDKFTQLINSTTFGLVAGTPAGFDPALSPVATTLAAGVTLNPGTKYYWRVRSAAPLISPWSATRAFTTADLATPFGLSQPAVGATDVPIKPILTWTAYKGAIWYEVTVSEDPSFAIPEFSHNVTQLFYGVEEELKYSTTYYWRVRGVTGEPYVKGSSVITPAGPWVVGAFTTMAEPKEAEPAVIIQKEPAPPPEIKIVEVPKETIVQQPIPSWMLLTIIVIGAVLIIALIVLIVRTRRVA